MWMVEWFEIMLMLNNTEYLSIFTFFPPPDKANQLIRKLDAGSSSDKNICWELFDILNEKLTPDDSSMDFSFGQKFVNCLTTGKNAELRSASLDYTIATG